MIRLLDLLVRCYEYDVEVFSQPWMYWCFLIPAAAYLAFFFVKWVVLTAPVWLPITLIVETLRRLR